MSGTENRIGAVGFVTLVINLMAAVVCGAQEAPAPVSRDDGGPARSQAGTTETESAPQQLMHPADGSRRAGLPVEAYAVTPGTRVLVRLEEDLNTGETKEGKRFNARTLEPMAAGSGKKTAKAGISKVPRPNPDTSVRADAISATEQTSR